MLNKEQSTAVAAIQEWLAGPEQFFLLSGAAGTGKTFCVRQLIDPKFPMVFTAPTNKATKVIREMLTTDDYTPICRTTYSLLGLRLEASGEVKQIKASDETVDLRKFKLIVVDEASMISHVLWRELQKAANTFKVKFLFLGDRNQLPPVKERFSPVWEYITDKAELVQVMRFDNQILGMAGRIRKQVDSPAPQINILEDNDGIEGIWSHTNGTFEQSILTEARNGTFDHHTKAIAWRNVTVDKLNQLIRKELFENSKECQWLVGDRIILTSPANDLEGKPIASTDDEGTIEDVSTCQHPRLKDFCCYRIRVMLDGGNKSIVLFVLHESSQVLFNIRKQAMSDAAKASPRLWKDFWDFVDTFHSIKYSYAITAHRAQGSTYQKVFVDWKDILRNQNRNEAFRCLYVACTRPQKKLILGSIL